MFKLYITGLSLLLAANMALADDLTGLFKKSYSKDSILSAEELDTFRNYDFYLVPGILSETFILNDQRSKLDFSILTNDYFSSHLKFLKNNGLKVERLNSSSYSVAEIRENIRKALRPDSNKAFFITHSLGGLALLEELVSNEGIEARVGGIIFIQSPFSGSPVAETFLKYPYLMDKWVKPILPFLNTSEETIKYLRTDLREKFMKEHNNRIEQVLRTIPVITVSGIANGHRSLFQPSIDLIEHGCIKGLINRCLTRKLYSGPYDQSDGMVPLKNSKLIDSDFVILDGADHGETVVSIPFGNYKKESVLTALMKLILPKLSK